MALAIYNSEFCAWTHSLSICLSFTKTNEVEVSKEKKEVHT